MAIHETASISETIDEFMQSIAEEYQERRTNNRFAYSVVQSFVPYNGQDLPTRDMFRQVLCRDLCTGGLSFIWPHAPDFDQVIIRLTAAVRTMYVLARVAHHRPLDRSNSRFVVGCEFVDRVHIVD